MPRASERRRDHLLGILSILLGLVWPKAAAAQANYESALIGGRSSLLGGTGVVFGTDAAVPFQNPAATVGIEGTSFVFSTFFLQLSGRRLDVDPALVDQVERGTSELAETKFRVLPTSTCLFFDLAKRQPGQPGSHKVSVCIAEPESEDFRLNSRLLASTTNGEIGFQNRFFSQEYSKKVYAAGWAMTLGRGFSFGVTPSLEQVVHKDTEGIMSLLADSTDPSQVVGATAEKTTNVVSRSASGYGLSALLGVRYQPGPRFGAGLSLQTPSLHLTGDYQSVRSSEQALGEAEEYRQEHGTARFTYPLRLAVGVAGTIGRTFVEANGYFHGARQDFVHVEATAESVGIESSRINSAEATNVTFQESTRPIANVGVGVQVPLTPDWALLFGVLTDFSGLPKRQAGSLADRTLFRHRADLVHGSVGFAWTPRIGSILIGTRFFYGQGELATSDASTLPPLQNVYEQRLWGLSLVVSGQLSLEMLALADPTGLVEKATTRESTPKD